METHAAANILIVDDLADSAHWLERLVRRLMNYNVQIAYSGAAALERIAEQAFDLVILDWAMPGMDGLETLKAIRQTHDMHQLPVIIISANSDSKDISEVFETGANDYIQKPTPSQIIRARIGNQIQQKHLADSRCTQLKKLERSNQAKTELIHAASHDLKNPLHSLNLLLLLVEPELQDGSTVSPYIQQGYGHISTMKTIINEFLEAEAENPYSNSTTVTTQPTPIEAVIQNVLEQYEMIAHEKNVTFVNNQERGVVLADAKRLRQAIGNLVSNAIKYTHPGTRVQVTGVRTENEFVLHIRDAGDGVPPDRTGDLFKPFSKLGNLPTSGETSSGLGLWIAKQMMEAQNGRVGFNAGYKNGADFFLALPLAPESISTAPSTS